ncbi:hypothetical protein [Ralstonia soli]|uniref:Uncharacterized protein n=1 Tax=Ralstonia soli TaxID=2953896 RepID=A0ABT1AJ53_9RALS|nr:hypothetical protein [Ralstonia soli]MCO5398334.1 hypothetical protein [Ralstonia soli]
MRKLLAAAALLILGTASFAQSPPPPVHIHNPFVTGTHYRELPDLMRRAYVMGVIDGMFMSPIFAFRDLAREQMLGKCVDAMRATDVQLTAIVDRYLDARPVAWGDGMHLIVFDALAEACGSIGMPYK